MPPVVESVVAEAADLDVGHAEARTDVRRQAPPGAEIEIGVGHEHPLGLAARVVVDAWPAGGEDVVRAVEVRLAAIFAGEIGAEPVVELVADAETEKRRAVPAHSDRVTDNVLGTSYRRWCRPLNCWLVMPMSPRRYQPEAENSSTGGMYTGGRLGMSAAFATVANNATAPATDATFTLTMTSPFRRAKSHNDSAKITNAGEDGSECLSRD